MRRHRLLVVGAADAWVDRMWDVLSTDDAPWTLTLCGNGEDALAHLAKQPDHVVIAPLELSGVTQGSTFLARVREQFPQAARLVLARDAERSRLALHSAQRVLLESSSDRELRDVLARTRRLHALVTDEPVRHAMNSLDRLPSAPRVYWALMEAAAKPNVSLAALAAIVESDPAMTAKILQLMSTPFFGVAQRVESVQHAIRMIGLDLLQGLVLNAHIFATVDARALKGFSVDDLQQRSLRVAKLAKAFVPRPQLRDEAFTAAMLHDVGELVLAVARARTQLGGTGVSHAEVGAHLLGLWGISASIMEIVAYHHAPSRLTDDVEGDFAVLASVHAADALLRMHETGAAHDDLDLDFLERTGFASELPRWRTLVQTECLAC